MPSLYGVIDSHNEEKYLLGDWLLPLDTIGVVKTSKLSALEYAT
jgi:hypothetical protein